MMPEPAFGVLSGDIGLLTFGLVGALGGVHCLGMCGPLVTMYADRIDQSGPVAWRAIRQHLLFNLGRTASYATVGAVMGLLGRVLYDAAAVATGANDVRAVAGVVVGTVIVVTGGSYLLTGTTTRSLGGFGGGRLFRRVSETLSTRIDALVAGPRIVLLGAVHGLLPCPLLYPAFLYVFAAGDPAYGAVGLGVLGLGTVPSVFAYGVAFQSISPLIQGPAHRVLGAAFLLLGYVPLAHGLSLFGIGVPHPGIPIYQPF